MCCQTFADFRRLIEADNLRLTAVAGRFSKGIIGNVRLYDWALGDEEVKDRYRPSRE